MPFQALTRDSQTEHQQAAPVRAARTNPPFEKKPKIYEGITAKGVLADLIPGYVNRGEALAAVRADGMALKRASPELRADREVVLAAVRQDVRALSHASPELQADRDVVLAAVRKRMMAMLAPVVAQVLAQVCAFYYPSLGPWALCLCVCSYPWLVVPLLRIIL